jgi:hypothetical protein
MVISKYLINAQYNKFQYFGAVVVACGIVVVLAPTVTGGGSIIWAVVMMVSCVPMTLSSVYKEISLGETELDPVRDPPPSRLSPPSPLLLPLISPLRCISTE